MFDNSAVDEHEQLVTINDEETGLRTIIAVHSTNLGPAEGGCRLWRYDDTTQAITDALRFSRGMSYKNAKRKRNPEYIIPARPVIAGDFLE